jgi:diadenosine tetraphosphatase ApaH/serine/threonine PP2A family protein phosphatase
MRIAALSDIHANHEALQAVLADLRTRCVDATFCLGDTVGYGGSPNACCDLVRTRLHGAVLGNHDAAVTGRLDFATYHESAQCALRAHSLMLSRTNLQWLAMLPYEMRLKGLSLHLCHGSPLWPETYGYVYDLWQAEECLEIFEHMAHLTFVGHSHLCRVFALTEDSAKEVAPVGQTLRPDRKYICSVGAVGQPRDSDPRASYVISDSDRQRLEFHRVQYDFETAAETILASNLGRDNALRLLAGSRLTLPDLERRVAAHAA